MGYHGRPPAALPTSRESALSRRLLCIPLILLAVFLFLVGLQLLLMGLLGELLIRIYHESQAKPTYTIRESWNVEESPPPREP